MKNRKNEHAQSKELSLIYFLWEKMYFRSIWGLALVACVIVFFLHELAGVVSEELYAFPLIVLIGLPILNVLFYFIVWIKGLVDGFILSKKEAGKIDEREKAYFELERAKKLLESDVINKEEYDQIVSVNKPKITDK